MKTLEELFCEHLGLKPGFVKSISSDGDWGFVIKVHALIEAALTKLITARFEEPLLSGILSRLSTSGEDDSKVSILKELDLLHKEHRRFIRSLSRLRNTFAHDIKHIDSTIAEYCAEDSKRAKELKDSIAPLIADPIVGSGIMPKTELIEKHLRLAIWACSLGTANFMVKRAAAFREKASPGSP